MRRQSEDILETLHWYLGEEFTKADTKTVWRHHRNLIIRAVNYKEIKQKKTIVIQEDNIIDNGENDEEFEVKEIENARELKYDKVYYDVETKQQEENFHEDKSTYITLKKTNTNIDTTSKIKDDDTATNSKFLAFDAPQKQITTNWLKYIEIKKSSIKPVNSSSKKKTKR